MNKKDDRILGDVTQEWDTVSDKKFKDLVESFFEANPKNRYWLLAMLYLAKTKSMTIIDNYTGDDDVIAEITIDDVADYDAKKYWVEKGISKRSVVAKIDDYYKEIIIDILDGHCFDFVVRPWKHQFIKEFDAMKDIEPYFMVNIARELMSISDEWYEKNVANEFHSIYQRAIHGFEKAINTSKHSHYGLINVPVEVVKAMVGILDAGKGSVYNPYADISLFGEHMNSYTYYCGQELSENYLISNINLFLHGKDNADCQGGDPPKDWLGGGGYDYIVSIPPLNQKCDTQFKTVGIDYLFRSSLNAKRKAIGLYPMSIFSDEKPHISDVVKSHLINRDLVETVVQLPDGIFGKSSSYVIVVTSKEKKHAGCIRFVDASSCCEINGDKTTLKLDDVLSLVSSDDCEGFTSTVMLKDVVANGFKLFPKLYTTSHNIPQGTTAIKLREILTPLKFISHDYGYCSRFFSPSDNTESVVNSEDLMIYEVDDLVDAVDDFRYINQDCLIIRTDGNFNAYYLVANNLEVFMKPQLCLYQLNNQVVDYKYLLNELSKEYFRNQVDAFGIKGLARNIKDFLDMYIMIPATDGEQPFMVLNDENMLQQEATSKLEDGNMAVYDPFENSAMTCTHDITGRDLLVTEKTKQQL